jgi:hypothetical protein
VGLNTLGCRSKKLFSGLASGRLGDKFPWQQFTMNRTEFVTSKSLPPNSQLREPSDMKKDEIENHLTYWRARQESEPTAAAVFSVKMYCSGRVSGDLEPVKNTKKSKRQEAKTKKGKKAVRSAGPEVQATGVPSAEGQWLNTGLDFGMASAVSEPANGERSLIDVNMPRNEGMATAIPTCGLSLAPDMQESYGGDEHLSTDLEVELDPELLDFL